MYLHSSQTEWAGFQWDFPWNLCSSYILPWLDVHICCRLCGEVGLFFCIVLWASLIPIRHVHTQHWRRDTRPLSRLSAPQIAQFLSPKSLITHQSSDQGFYKGDYESWWAKVLQRWQRSSISRTPYYSGTRPLNSYLISVGGWHRKSATNVEKWMSETVHNIIVPQCL